LVVEADGGSRGNPGPAGYGAVVLDADTGEALEEVAESIGRATNNVAEYRGLVAGLRAAVRIDPTCTIEVRMDSKLVVEQMSGRWRIKHEELRGLAARARGVLPADRVRYTWIPRAENARADRLANEAMDAAAAGRSWSRDVRRDAATSASVSASSAPDSARAPQTEDGGAPTVLLLVRHGRTQLTEQRRFSGRGGADPALSPAGEADAARVAELLAMLGAPGSPLPETGPPTAVVSSPIRRARQTADAIGAQLGLTGSVVDGWAEIAFGAWDGLTFAEIAERWPEGVRRWQGSLDFAPPGGESLRDLVARVRAVRAATVAAHPGQVVVVATHGVPIRVAVQEALDAGPAALWRTRVDPASVTAIRYWTDGGIEVVTVNAVPPARSA
jgi:probable phosphoglycerate mutase